MVDMSNKIMRVGTMCFVLVSFSRINGLGNSNYLILNAHSVGSCQLVVANKQNPIVWFPEKRTSVVRDRNPEWETFTKYGFHF